MVFVARDQIAGALFDLVINTADVFAQNANRHELNPRKQHDARRQRGPARQVGAEQQRVQQNVAAIRQRQQRYQRANHAPHAQRQIGKRGQPQQGQRAQAAQVKAGTACRAVFWHKRQRGRLKAHPGVQAFHETVALRQRLQGIHHFAVQPAEIARVGWHLDMAAGVQQTVKQPGTHALGAAFCCAVGNGTVHHVVARQPQRVHFRHQGQRVLKIGINQQHRIAARIVNTGSQRRFFAKVS